MQAESTSDNLNIVLVTELMQTELETVGIDTPVQDALVTLAESSPGLRTSGRGRYWAIGRGERGASHRPRACYLLSSTHAPDHWPMPS